MSKDLINNPDHYTFWWIEVWDFIIANKLSYFQWNIIKYICRYPHKGGIEDLEKCQAYINRLIKHEKELLIK
jgi:hypothetical protein